MATSVATCASDERVCGSNLAISLFLFFHAVPRSPVRSPNGSSDLSDASDNSSSGRGRGRGRSRAATQVVGSGNGSENGRRGQARMREMDTSEESLAERRNLRPRLGSASRHRQ